MIACVEHVRVGVARQPAVVRDLDPAEHQSPPFGEPVAVVADPGLDAHPPRSLSSSAAMCRSVGVVTLRLSGLDRTTRTAPPACSISQASSVARGQQLVGGTAQRTLERGAAEHLRRLDGPQARALERPCDSRAVVADLLDRVRHRRGGDHGVGARATRARRARARTARAWRAGGRRRGRSRDPRRPRRRARPARTPSAPRRRRPAIVPARRVGERVGGQRDHDPGDRADARAAWRRSSRASAAPKAYERLGPAGPKALATSRGHDQRDRHSRQRGRLLRGDRHLPVAVCRSTR